MKTIIWGNYKGGVGKTTSTYQVATYFAQHEKKVLLIDLDPQCSLSNICCGGNSLTLSDYKADAVLNYIIELYMRYINSKNSIDFELLNGNRVISLKDKLEKMCVNISGKMYSDNLYFIPSSISFENCRLNELAQRMEKNIYNIFLLYLLIKDIEDLQGELKFDYLFIDCPPTSNILIQGSFLASDFYIVPTIIDEISAKGVADYITEIEKTYMKYIMNENIGSILINTVFGNKTKLVGVFETIYKERRGRADNSTQIVSLDNNINNIAGVKSIVSDEKYEKYRNGKVKGSIVSNIFGEYIGHRDNRSGGESIPQNTNKGIQTSSYGVISEAIFEILEDQK